MKKVLNLYASIGGNRKLWTDVDVTAVEINPQIAKIYSEFFPDDKVIVADAHQYLLDHFNDGFDFIWSSPPCPTHSKMNNFLFGQGHKRYPDMTLYQEIIFLRQWCKIPFVVENVVSYYDPLIKPHECGRHYFWSNFFITDIPTEKETTIEYVEGAKPRYGFSIRGISVENKRQIMRNLVDPKVGLHVFNCVFKYEQKKLSEVL